VQPRRSRVDYHLGAVAHFARQQLAAQCGFQFALDHAPQRTRAVDRIVAALGEVVARLVRQFDFDLALGQPFAQPAHLNIDDLAQLILCQRMEHHNLVDAVEELGPEVLVHALRSRMGEIAATRRTISS